MAWTLEQFREVIGSGGTIAPAPKPTGIHVLTCCCKLCRQFQEFHRLNPDVYKKLVELARLVKSKGCRHYAIEGLWQQLRWHYMFVVERTPTVVYKFCDHHRTRYARLIMEQEADLVGFFSLKTMDCEDF